MNQSQLEKLIEGLVALPKETETVEFKENYFTEDEIGERISALSNSANLFDQKFSYLIFGIKNETHDIVGTTFKPTQKKIGNMEMEHWLSRLLDPKIDFRIYEFLYKDKDIVIFQIPPAIDHPVKFKNTSYIRIGSNTTNLKSFPEKERKIWNNIRKNSFEKGIAKEGLTVEEVLELLDYSRYFSLTKQKLPSDTNKFVGRMTQHKLVRKILDNNYDITNLGAILFAKNLNNFDSVKRKSIRIIIYKNDTRKERKKESEVLLGYAIAFESLLDYINDKLPHSEEISKALRKETRMYPEVAIREFVANALIHQDLSISGAGPMIEIFKNRIEITNTGEPLIDTDRFIDHPPRSRNEDMASFMRQIGICEEAGTGVDRALIDIAIYQLPAPSFEKYDKFTKITLYAKRLLKDMSIDDKVRACFQHCVLKHVERKRMTNATLRERLGIGDANYPTASKIIAETIKKNFIKESEKKKEYVPIWA